MMNIKTIAAGILPFYDDGKTICLGNEYRKAYNTYHWMEFGGKQEPGQTLAETAWREASEESAGTLNIALYEVEQAEVKGHYIDHFNEKSGVFYRMYCIKVSGPAPDPLTFKHNSVGKQSVEKVEWAYFDAKDVIYSPDGSLPGTDHKLYSTFITRLAKLRDQPFLVEFIN